MTDRQRDESAMLLTASIIQNLSDKTWLSGLSDALAAIQDPMRNGPWFFRKAAAGIVTPAASGQLARTIDPTQRETKTVAEAVKARIPGMSARLRPKLDVWGRAVTKDGGVGPDIMSPIYTSTQDNDPVTAEALAIGLRLGDPARKVGGRNLNVGEFHRYREMAGQLNYIGLANAMAGVEWRTIAREHLRADTQRGHWLGFGVTIAAIAGSVGCALMGQPWVAAALVGVPVLSVAKALVDSAKSHSTPMVASAPPAANNPPKDETDEVQARLPL